jgi:hypothetical protein
MLITKLTNKFTLIVIYQQNYNKVYLKNYIKITNKFTKTKLTESGSRVRSDSNMKVVTAAAKNIPARSTAAK